MKVDAEPASIDELLAFANAIRECGDSQLIKALMPSIPQEPDACLIAKNINCDSQVHVRAMPKQDRSGKIEQAWVIDFPDLEVAERVAEKLKLQRSYTKVRLPKRFARIAYDFDLLPEALNLAEQEYSWQVGDTGKPDLVVEDYLSDDQIAELKALAYLYSYIDAGELIQWKFLPVEKVFIEITE